MKNSLLFFLLLCFTSLHLSAQQYTPFLADSNRWHVGYELSRGSMYTIIYYTGTDTVVNNKTYKNVWSDGTISSSTFIVREDTLLQRVYFANHFRSNDERLLYDFSLQTNDTIYLNYDQGGPAGWFRADSVFTINVLGGQVRKAIWLSLYRPDFGHKTILEPISGGDGLLWIEGVGSTMSPFYIHDDQGYRIFHGPEKIYTMCSFRNGMHEFAAVHPDSCYGEMFRDTTVSVFPLSIGIKPTVKLMNSSSNPHLSVFMPSQGKMSIQLYDLTGRLIQKEDVLLYEGENYFFPEKLNGLSVLRVELKHQNEFLQFTFKLMGK